MFLSEYKLLIPTVLMKDWQEAVESASGLIREVLNAQTSGVGLLKVVQEVGASTERIGWLNLWAKTFAALETVAAAITHRSKLGLLMSQRNTFELMLQTHTVMDPLRKFIGVKKAHTDNVRQKKDEEYALRSCVDRLRAYTAWCLWHDKAYLNEMLNPKSMKDIWNFEFYDALQKQANPTTQAELFLKKVGKKFDEKTCQQISREVRKMYTEKIKQIDEWMADPRLRKWETAIERARKQNIVGVPFFILFDQADASIPKRLLKEGMRFSYPSYILSSIASHGSSMEEFIQIEGDSISPILTGNNEHINMLAPEIISRCQHIFTILEIINNEMTKNPQIRS